MARELKVIDGFETLWWKEGGRVESIHICPFKGNTLLVVVVERFTPRGCVTKVPRKPKVSWGTWGPEPPERAERVARAMLLACKLAREV